MIRVTIDLPDKWSHEVSWSRLEAAAPKGYAVEASCTRWSRGLDGSIQLTIEALVKSPPNQKVLP